MSKFIRLILAATFVCSSFGALFAAESVDKEIADGYAKAGIVEWVQEITGGRSIRINSFEPGEGMDASFATNLFRTPLLNLEYGGKSIRVEEAEGARTEWTLSGTVHLDPAVNTACAVVLELKQGRRNRKTMEVSFDSPNIIAAIMPVTQGFPVGEDETTTEQAGIAAAVADGYTTSPINGPISDSATGESPAVEGKYKVKILASDGKPYNLQEYELKARKDGATIGEIYQCELNKGKPFKLLIENNSEGDAAVEVFIDGVSALALWEGSKPDFFIAPKGGMLEIPGWLTSASGKANGKEFVAGYYKDSVAKSLGVNPRWEEGKSEISFLFRRAGEDVKDLGPDDDAPGVGAGNKIDVPTEVVDIPVAATAHCKISVWYSVR